MPYSSDRGQTEPIAALAAVFAVGIALTLYAGAVDSTLPALTSEREMAPTAADRLLAEAEVLGAVRPPLDRPAAEARPTGYDLNATLRAGGSVWTAGEPQADTAECERRATGVRVAPGQVRPGVLEVCVWRAG